MAVATLLFLCIIDEQWLVERSQVFLNLFIEHHLSILCIVAIVDYTDVHYIIYQKIISTYQCCCYILLTVTKWDLLHKLGNSCIGELHQQSVTDLITVSKV